MNEDLHLSAERIQALLDGQLPPGDAARDREHGEACARCRERVEAWTGVFASLEGLEALAAPDGFGERVMEALPGRAAALPWTARVRSWLLAPDPAAAAAVHADASRLQEMLDGRLRGRAAAAAEAHLASCGACRGEMEALARVVAAMGRLPRLAPSAGFGEGVMASVRVPEPASSLARLGRGALVRAREVLSLRTRRAWAAVAGVAFTPAVVAATLAWVVFSNPLVTVRGLVSFLWTQGGERILAAAAWAGTAVNGPLLRASSTLEGVSIAPETAVAGFIAFAALTLVALWVLYANLFTPAVERR